MKVAQDLGTGAWNKRLLEYTVNGLSSGASTALDLGTNPGSQP